MADAAGALEDAYRDVRAKRGKGAEHAREVAAILRAAGSPESVQVVGLLHDVVEDTDWTLEDVAERFGPKVAETVAALTEDDEIGNCRRRKRALRTQIAAAGSPATDVALADKIASLRYLQATGRRLPKRKRAHYDATLSIAAASGQSELVSEVGRLLEALAERDATT